MKGMVTKVKRSLKRTASLLLAALLTLSALMLTSCGAPKLEDVKDDFIKLIKDSYSVNEVLFGRGLSGYGVLEYDSETGTYYSLYYTKNDGYLCAYRDKALGKYIVLSIKDSDGEGCVYKDEARGKYYFPTDLEYSEGPRDLPDTPYGYRHVRADERCTTISEITAYASAVYSEDYLADLFTILFDSSVSSDIDTAYSAKYMEMTVEESGKTYLLCADTQTCPPIDSGDRVYDYESIKIGARSRNSYVNVEIRAYGQYADIEKGETVVGWHTVKLSFTKQNGEWRLDSPTY